MNGANEYLALSERGDRLLPSPSRPRGTDPPGGARDVAAPRRPRQPTDIRGSRRELTIANNYRCSGHRLGLASHGRDDRTILMRSWLDDFRRTNSLPRMTMLLAAYGAAKLADADGAEEVAPQRDATADENGSHE